MITATKLSANDEQELAADATALAAGAEPALVQPHRQLERARAGARVRVAGRVLPHPRAHGDAATASQAPHWPKLGYKFPQISRKGPSPS